MQRKKNITRLTRDQLNNFAVSLGNTLRVPTLILLEGGLGAGKTTFARFLIQYLMGSPCEVPSPTFTLVQMYDSPQGPIHHYDLYRLHHWQDAIELGLEESLKSAITLIEWPELIEEILIPPYVRLTFSLVSDIERDVTYEVVEHA